MSRKVKASSNRELMWGAFRETLRIRYNGNYAISRILYFLVLSLAGTALLFGQGNIGRINGTVTDPAGAVLPNAKVTAVQEGTEATQEIVTQADGAFAFPSLPPGTYTVTATANGFTSARTAGVVLDVGATRVVNFALTVGAATQEVTVAAQAQQVDTQSAVIASTVNPRELSDIPLNGRWTQELLVMLPGQSGTPGTGYSLTGQALNGLGGGTLFLTVDGVSDTELGGTGYKLNFNPTPDAVEELRIQTSSYSPELGGHSGSQMNFTIKSGTRALHGSVYEYFRNSITDSRSYFALTTPLLHYNDFGGTIGGPIKLPGRLNMKDKLFYFVSGERKIVDQDTPTTALVPTTQMLQGNFAGQSILGTPTTQPNYPGTKTPFLGGVVPSSMWSVNGPKLLSAYQMYGIAPNYPGPGGNYIFNAFSAAASTTLIGKVDYVPNEKRRIQFTEGYDTYDTEITDSVVGQRGVNRPYPGYMFRVGDTETFSNTLLLSTAFSITHNRSHTFSNETCRSAINYSAPELYPTVWNGDGQCTTGLAPEVTISGTQALANPLSGNQANPNEYLAYAGGAINVDLSKVINRHTLKFGTVLTRIRRNNIYWGFGSGAALDGVITFSNQNNVNTTGNAIADALLGIYQSYAETDYQEDQFVRQTVDESYAQDSWNVTHRLHIDYGVRYSYIPWYYLVQNNFDSFVPSDFNPAMAPQISATTGLITSAPGTYNPYNGLEMWGNNFPDTPASLPYSTNPAVLALFKGIPRSGAPTNWRNIGPRIGVSYDPFGNGKTAIRSGFGTFFDRPASDAVSQQGGSGNPPFQTVTTLNVGNIDNPSGGAASNSPPGLTSFTTTLKTPSVMTYNLGIQQQLPGNLILDTGYVGNVQRHLLQPFNINALPVGTKFAHPTVASAGSASLEQYQGYGAISMNSYSSNGYYNSWQSTLSRRTEKGLSLSASFTWARGMAQTFQQTSSATPSTTTGVLSGGNSNVPLIYTPTTNFSKLAFTANAQYLLPALTHSGFFARNLLGGWTTSTVVHANDGNLTTLVCSGDPGGIYATATLCPLSGNPNQNAPHTVAQWFNTSAVAAVSTIPNGQFSSQYPGGVVRLPGLWDWDQSIFKAFNVHESQRVEFRMESFNLPNHPNWTSVAIGPGATFGQVTAAGPGRVFQAALKYTY